MTDRLIIAAAGSGKTTYLVKKALEINDGRILITTFTEQNNKEILKKFIEINGCVPANVVVQTWFSFLLQHGVKPYQSVIFDTDIKGLKLVNEQSGLKCCIENKKIYYGEKDKEKYYCNDKMQMYSDKIAKFVCKANILSKGCVVERISKIYKYIFIDEIQDMAGYDLEIIKLLLKSKSNIIMVGDPRQVTYHTHYERKYRGYADGKIEDFIRTECSGCEINIDKETLNKTFRNQKNICKLANSIYPEYGEVEFEKHEDTGHDGVFFVYQKDLAQYLRLYSPIQLRNDIRKKVDCDFPVMNFGDSKGCTFDRVIIYPTAPMLKWLLNHENLLEGQSKSKLYVAVTRAKYSVGIVVENGKEYSADGIEVFST